MKALLEIRKKSKARKPKFMRSDSNRLKFKNKWRKPRGLHNKRRLQKDGHQKNPSQGFRSPAMVRGLHESGLEIKNIQNIKQIQEFDSKKYLAELSSTIGLRKKIEILKLCKEKGIQILNLKDIDKFIKQAEKQMEESKKAKQKKEQKKKKSKEEAAKKAEEKKKAESGEEKQEKVKEEVLKSKPQSQEKQKVQTPTKDVTQSKAGHQASSVPGTKQ